MDSDAMSHLLGTIIASSGVQMPIKDAGVPFVVVPDGYRVHDLEQLLEYPVTTRARVSLCDTASFVAYVNAFKDETSRGFNHGGGHTTSNRSCEVVIDYHDKLNSSHCRHVVALSLAVSEQWKRWSAISGNYMSQLSMAEFLEENAGDIADPDAATMLEIAKNLEATKSGAFKSGQRLKDGSFQLSYSEEVQATTKGGALDIPDKINLAIPVFYRGAVNTVPCWFRYRIDEGKLKLCIKIHRPQFILDAEWDLVMKDVSENTKIPIHEGTW